MPVMKTKPITMLYSGVLICVLCCSCYVSDGNPFVDVKLSAEAKKKTAEPGGEESQTLG